VPRPLTDAQLLAAADAAEAEAARYELKALSLREQARLLRQTAAANAPLTIGGNRSKVDSNMQGLDVADKPENVRTAASRTRLDSEAKRALLLKVGSDADVAKLLGIGRSTVQAYHADRLQIPERHVKTLEKKGVPRTVWKRISAD
jgi:hypothetical protein